MIRSTRTSQLPTSFSGTSHAGIGETIRVLLTPFAMACARYRQRRHLAELDDHQLTDIGLTRRDVERECAKPFWEV